MSASTLDWGERIVSDPAICHGKRCIKGTRIMPSVVLGALAEGLTADEIVKQYGSLTVEDVRAALGYAAHLAWKREQRRRR